MGMQKRDELLKKGTPERPFYLLQIEWAKPFCGKLEIVPYLFVEEHELGPKLVMKHIWPDLSHIDLSIPVAFWFQEKSGIMSLETNRSSLIKLACEIEENYNIYASDEEMQINAALVIGFCDQKMLTEKGNGLPTAVKFFTIEVRPPKNLGQKDWEILKKWQIIE